MKYDLMLGKRFTLIVTLALATSVKAGNRDGDDIITFDVPGAQLTKAIGIVEGGLVFGLYLDSSHTRHGFLRSPDGRITTIDAPNAVGDTVPEGLNAFGVSSGLYQDSSGTEHSWVRGRDGEFLEFDPPGATQSEASNVNAFGVVSGDFYDANTVSYGYVRSPGGHFEVYDVPGMGTDPGSGEGVNADAFTGMNIFGENTGFYTTDLTYIGHGYVRAPNGQITTFDAPNSPQGTYPSSINAEGTIVGVSYDSGGNAHSFSRDRHGEITVLDVPFPGASQTAALTNNDTNEIVGTYSDMSGNTHGFVRFPDGEFRTVDVPNATATAVLANNNEGAMTGYFQDSKGVLHGFIIPRCY